MFFEGLCGQAAYCTQYSCSTIIITQDSQTLLLSPPKNKSRMTSPVVIGLSQLVRYVVTVCRGAINLSTEHEGLFSL